MVVSYKKRLEDKTNVLSGSNSIGDMKPIEIDNDIIITLVTKAVTAIMNRLNSLAQFDGTDSKVSTLVAAANSHDNLCRMDPAWQPWL